MTITELPTRNEYIASAGQTVFTYTFRIFEEGDISAFVTPSGQEADDSVDEVSISSVTGVGDEDGGTITIAATSADDKVTIVSNIAQDRETDYQTNGDFSATVVNLDFDKTVSLVKQLSDEISRSLKFQTSEQDVSGLTLPAPEAESVLQWKTDLSGLQNFPIPDLSELTTGGDTALHYHSADRARAVHTGTQTAATISDFDTEVTNNATVAGHSTKLGYITVSQAVDLDVMEDNQTHTGDVTGSKVLTIADDAVTIAKLSATGTPNSSTFHRGDDVWTSLPTAATISDAVYTRAGWDGDTTNAASKNAISDMSYYMVRVNDLDTGGAGNVLIGNTGNESNVGVNNTFGGEQCGYLNTSGSYSSYYGRRCGYSNTIASNNNGFGSGVLYSMALGGEHNCGFGTSSLVSLNHDDAEKNSGYGNYSLENLVSGYGCVGLGYGTGAKITTGHNVVCIGPNAGPTTNVSDSLYINNEESSTPLIFGFFAAAPSAWVGIKGRLAVGNTVTSANCGEGNLYLQGGVACLKETTTPTADGGVGKIYFKSDNKLYAQDGAGVEHEVAFV